MLKIIAKTTDGKEYLYSRKWSFRVPNKSAQDICAIMNHCKWMLKDGEKWYVYTVEQWEIDSCYAASQWLSIYRGIVKAHGLTD